jgi:hypothetical protein
MSSGGRHSRLFHAMPDVVVVQGLGAIVASRIETGQLADVRLGAPHRIGSIADVADRDVTLDNNTQQKG